MASAMELATTQTGGRLVAVDGRVLPLTEMRLGVEARGGLARVLVEQSFENPYDDPLMVTYLLPLPADGAVSGFAFRIGERRIVGEVEGRAAAREAYERALVEGRSASILEQERSSLFTQEVGNIPPRTGVVVEMTVDQRLAWLDEGAWEWRFPTTVSPRYQGGPGRVADAERISVDVAEGDTGARVKLALTIGDELAAGRRAESPSHEVAFEARPGATLARLRDADGAPLDRDVVVRWPVAEPEVGLSLATARPNTGKLARSSAFGVLTIVPPRREAIESAVPRDLIILVDTSGSMSGAPLAQAKRVAAALVQSLSEADTLELIEFSTAPNRWRDSAAAVTAAAREEALEWIRAVEAGGATEMRTGLYAALAPLRAEAQRQVVLITDGQIGFESEIVATILEKLPSASRLSVVGVGSSVNRSLTQPAARAGHGVEVVIGIDEDVERVIPTLLARSVAPVVTELALSGSALQAHAPERLPDLFAGAPVLVGLRLEPKGGRLELHGTTARGPWSAAVDVPPTEPGEGAAAAASFYGREVVEDLEMRVAAGEKARRKLESEIERIGLDLQLATRLTSWVAMSEVPDVDPRRPVRREKMPHQLPHGVSAEGLGLRSAAPALMCAEFAAAYDQPQIVKKLYQSRVRTFQQSRVTTSGQPRGKRLQRSRTAVEPQPPASAPHGLDGRADGRSRKGPEPQRPASLPAAPGRATAHRALEGTWRWLSGTTVSAYVEADEAGLVWDPESPVRVLLSDGAWVEGTIDRERTTERGRLERGQVARLILELSHTLPEAVSPARLELTNDGRSLIVKLTRAA